MAPPKYTQPRPDIPAELRRAAEVEAGHTCLVTRCGEHTYLEVHHINGNREDNRLENIALLCDKHHKMAHANVIDRKALDSYKVQLVTNLRDALQRSPDASVLASEPIEAARAEFVLSVASITGLFILEAAARSSERHCGFPLARLIECLPRLVA